MSVKSGILQIKQTDRLVSVLQPMIIQPIVQLISQPTDISPELE